MLVPEPLRVVFDQYPDNPVPLRWVVSLCLSNLPLAVLCGIALLTPRKSHLRPPLWTAMCWYCLQGLDELVGGNFFGMGQMIELSALTVAMLTTILIGNGRTKTQ